MVTITLTQDEIDILDRQSPTSRDDGGYQSLLVQLQAKVNRTTRKLTLSDKDLERIQRYAFDYGNGGWESRLLGTFGRTFGPKLGR